MILIVSGMMMVALKYASISAKHVGDTYMREQNELFLNSAIEQTLLAISMHNRSAGCLEIYNPTSVVKRGVTYSATVNIKKYYLQQGGDCSGSAVVAIQPSSELSEGMALLEVESLATKSDGTIVSRILRRTLQQP